MLLQGPDGGNLGVTVDGVILRSALDRDVNGNGVGQLQVLFEDMLCVQIVENCKIKISFTDFSVNQLEVKTLCQEASDVETLQKVFTSIKVINLVVFCRACTAGREVVNAI